MQEVLVGEPLEVDSITSTQDRLVVMEDVPGKTGTRTKVLVETALRRAAVSDTGRTHNSRQRAVGRKQEWVLVGHAGRIKDRAAEQQVVGKLQ